jgi:hypothetical protein
VPEAAAKPLSERLFLRKNDIITVFIFLCGQASPPPAHSPCKYMKKSDT